MLVTGETGFKGAWLALELVRRGAAVTGFGLAAPTQPSLWSLARVGDVAAHVDGDVRDRGAVTAAVGAARPDVVLHLAAQPLVRRSYAEPVETFAVNVMGTAHVLEASRSVPVVVCVTTDKVYANRGLDRGYREDEPLGGHDPYSASKAAAELVIDAYRSSFAGTGSRVCSARAGNVFGGGDFAADRLVPDAVRALVGGEALRVRNPGAVRPWQHVLNPLSGYLLLAEAAYADAVHARAYNFGPADADAMPVGAILDRLAARFAGELRWVHDGGEHPHEARTLHLDSTLARAQLGWTPRWALEQGLDATAEWTQAWRGGDDLRDTTLAQLEAYAAT